jgi:hypothetical protein
MAAIQFRQRRVRRMWYLGMTIATATALVVLFVGGASASLPGSTFGGGDGNLTCMDANGALDWNCLSTSGTPQLHIGLDEFTGQQDNSFGQGTKENDPDVTLVQGSIPPQKSDLTRFYEASEVISGYPAPNTDHVLLYLAWERTNVLGSANMDFEINKVGTPCLDSTGPFPVHCTINRSIGDILVTYDFTQGGGTPTIGLRTWDGSTWQVSSTVVSESAVNSVGVLDTHANLTLAANTFGEVAIDLTASGLATGCGFASATTFLKSRSSAQFQSEVKDFVAPVSTPIAPCAPSITTTLSAESVSIGTAVHDSATLSGATSDAGGTVAYRYYSTQAACEADTTGTGGTSAGTVTVTNGVVPDSDSVTFNSAGTFYWAAFYSGDATNTADKSDCATEVLVVNPNLTALVTAQNLIPNDDATLSGATSTAGGTITFSLFSPSDPTCAGTPALTQPVTVSGNGTYSTTNTTFIASAEGTWRWQVVYSGDANNVGSTSACGVERFTIANS